MGGDGPEGSSCGSQAAGGRDRQKGCAESRIPLPEEFRVDVGRVALTEPGGIFSPSVPLRQLVQQGGDPLQPTGYFFVREESPAPVY